MRFFTISKNIKINKSSIVPLNGFFTKNKIKKGEILVDINEKNQETPYIKLLNKVHNLFLSKFGHFFKHSCDPNLALKIDRSNMKRVKFITLRDIIKDEELVCNYNTIYWDIGKGFVCNCGSKNCVRIVKGMKWLTEVQQNKLQTISTSYIKERLAFKKDRVDELNPEDYSKTYESKVTPWSLSARKAFNEALDFALNYELPRKGKCIEIGVYKGESFLKLIKKFGLANCVGVDIGNYAKLPNIIVQDIKTFNETIPVKLGVNDLPYDCPQSKLAAHKWLYKNVIKRGLIILTGYRDLDLKKYSTKNLIKIYENMYIRIYKKNK